MSNPIAISNHLPHNNFTSFQRHRGNTRPFHRSFRGGQRGRDSGREFRSNQPQWQPNNLQWHPNGHWQWTPSQWHSPPSHYPTAAPAHHHSRQPPHSQPHPRGLLGNHPQPHQTYAAAVHDSPTDIEAAMHTLGLTPPDGNWYMDTGATSHMTSDSGTWGQVNFGYANSGRVNFRFQFRNSG